jgi:hypothetical protein
MPIINEISFDEKLQRDVLTYRWESDWEPYSPRRAFDRDTEFMNFPLLAPQTRWVGRDQLERSKVCWRRITFPVDRGLRAFDDAEATVDTDSPVDDRIPLNADENAMLRRRARRILAYQLRKYVMKRAVALYWLECTQRALCAPGGAGRAADAMEFESDF